MNSRDTATYQPEHDEVHQCKHSSAARQDADLRTQAWVVRVRLLSCCRKGIEWEEVEDLAAVAGQVDVLYQTRIQKASALLCSHARHHHTMHTLAARSVASAALVKLSSQRSRIVSICNANGLQERFLDRLEDYAAARGKYIIDKQLLGTLKRDAVIMHPLPRVDEVRCHSCRLLVCWQLLQIWRSRLLCERGPLQYHDLTCHHNSSLIVAITSAQITTDVDDDPRAAYFRQAKNGLYIRMALLKLATKDRIIAN